LWFCSFFNYADRQAVFAVFPLLKTEFALDDKAKGLIGSAFMVVYAAMSPVAGMFVDRYARRWLVAGGLAVWSAICAATALARTYPQLLWFRAMEGLGESCYFPASMSLLADHHGPRTRSRAMSLHQTSVYLGTALGAVLAGTIAARFGWRAPFVLLGAVGFIYAMLLPVLLQEPPRERNSIAQPEVFYAQAILNLMRRPAVLALLGAFACANFVAAAFLTWLPDFVYRKFLHDVAGSAVLAGLPWPLANLVGALAGGWLADRAIRCHPGGRAWVQALGLAIGTPWIFVVGSTHSLAWLVAALIVAGLGKGFYDANIFAALYEVVEPEVRGVAAGLMNTVGWVGGLMAPVIVGAVSDQSSLSNALSALAALYICAAACAVSGACLTPR
jgi:MFS family permease